MPRKKKKSVDERIIEKLDLDEGTAGKIVKAAIEAEPVEGEIVDAPSKAIAPVGDTVEENALGFPTVGENPEIQEDYKSAREILNKTGEQAQEALDQMKDVAEQGQAAREYEVVGQLIKANAELAKAKIDLHKDMKALREQEAGKSSQRAAHIGDVNQAIVVGTTKDLQDMMKAGKLPKGKPKKTEDE